LGCVSTGTYVSGNQQVQASTPASHPGCSIFRSGKKLAKFLPNKNKDGLGRYDTHKANGLVILVGLTTAFGILQGSLRTEQ